MFGKRIKNWVHWSRSNFQLAPFNAHRLNQTRCKIGDSDKEMRSQGDSAYSLIQALFKKVYVDYYENARRPNEHITIQIWISKRERKSVWKCIWVEIHSLKNSNSSTNERMKRCLFSLFVSSALTTVKYPCNFLNINELPFSGGGGGSVDDNENIILCSVFI